MEVCPMCQLPSGARQLLALILEYVESDIPTPSHAQLALALGVERRTIQRWARQLRDSGLADSSQGRVGIIPLVENTQHPIENVACSPQHPIENVACDHDHIRSKMSHVAPNIRSKMSHVGSPDRIATPSEINIRSKMSHVRSVGGGGDHDLSSDPPPPPTHQPKTAQPCETRLGRFLAANGIVAARLFDREELDADRWIAWFKVQRAERLTDSRIVSLMKLGAPLDWIPPVPIAPAQDDAGAIAPAELRVGMSPEDAERRYQQLHGQKRWRS